jgi:serine/threonine-protein kinase HipA
MAKRKTHIPLGVFLNGRRVGLLNRESTGAIEFTYDTAWLEWEHALPVSLSLPLTETRFSGERVIAVFDNLLPDNEKIRRSLAERFGANGYDVYSLLAAVGRDCVGALQFLPNECEPEAVGSVLGREVSEEDIARILGSLAINPLGNNSNSEFRLSLAGAQEKTALLFHEGKWLEPQGSAPTTHIFKPVIGRLANGVDMSDSVENEHECMQLCAALGLPTAKTAIHTFCDTKALVIERFDRVWTKDGRLLRRPQEDMCQALGISSARKYEADGGVGIKQIEDLLKSSDTPMLDRRTFLKAQMVFWLLGATDGHAKNFSIFLSSGGRFTLAPLYDILSTQRYLDQKQLLRKEFRMAMAVGENRHYKVDEIFLRHFEQTAKHCDMPLQTVAHIIEEIHAAASKIHCDSPIWNGFRKRMKRLE